MISIAFVLSFVVAYILGGRKIGIPYGVLVAGNPWIVVSLALILDVLQIPFFYFLYDSGKKIRLSRHVAISPHAEKKEIKKYSIWSRMKKFGVLGVFILSTLPSFGGGVWSAVFLAFTLKTDRKIAYFIITLGSIVGIVLASFFAQGLIALLKFLFIFRV